MLANGCRMPVLNLENCSGCGTLQPEGSSRCRSCGRRAAGGIAVSDRRRRALAVVIVLLVAVVGVAFVRPGGREPAGALTQPIVLRDRDDPRSVYRLVAWRREQQGTAEALVQRDGTSGRSFSRREIDCANGRARELGAGDSLSDSISSRAAPPYAVPPAGSIWAQAVMLVCRSPPG
ncbi:hypothetical protein C7I55_26620 [Sphingomonas deserti]|uniref:Uncharacterized protein n=1 Tax=Allosphingosinicella deserti TaxID=2116704 RepID=A0A2P7QEQ4_9SPHN|nr:hypothetical protein C7I55_26620 [Sphingomonas deserti]